MATLEEIEILALKLSEARSNLKDGLSELEETMAEAKKKYLPAIRRAVEKAAGWHQRLHSAISEAPELFTKPKTYIFHGIKLGYMKAKGEIIWEDEDQVIKLIKKHFPDDWEAYVKITEKPIKTNLAQLSAVDLKKIGVTVTDTSDEVFIKPTDSEIDKLINALLKDEEIATQAA